jgi:beta-galactosidase
MELRGAEAIAKYEAGFCPGGAAITCNHYGKGKAYYIGTQPSQECCDALMDMIATDAGVKPGVETPEGVDASVRTGKSGSLLFLANHSEEPKSFARPEGFATNAITGDALSDTIHLDHYEVAVLKS